MFVGRVRVLETIQEGEPPVPIERLGVQGCVRGMAGAHLLGFPAEEEGGGAEQVGSGVQHETLAGTMVGYEQESNVHFYEGGGFADHYLVVRNLRDGRLVRRVPTGTPLERETPDGERFVGVGPVVAIAVKPDGAAAWIAEDYERGNGLAGYRDVYAAEGAGTRLLARGHGIPAASLRVRHGVVQWTQAGKRMMAELR